MGIDMEQVRATAFAVVARIYAEDALKYVPVRTSRAAPHHPGLRLHVWL